MIALLDKIANGASGIVRITGQVAAWSGLALVLLVAFNVLARYLFSFGTVALQEAEWHLMAVGALFGMAYGLNQGGEVRVDIFHSRMRPRARAAVDLFASLCMGATALIIAWLSIAYVQSSFAINEGSPDPGGLGYRYILKACMPVAFALLALQNIAMTAEHLRDLIRPRPLAED
ncbi:TRAP transporter small permease subunit [Tropicimonas sediminicola]|uniref:TRAP transporter small permease protein n=1 Tax=Tropicimonas sediminicola TaxID=1031541 RepID=A0A239LQ32_9RHOB|nr:TRAP transporter small permease subunit [Tropicimonas sediminicola]SNT32022.1 TRAP-type mannitol/chloroaromatic compound transport system, small permease component [Tropicimonas sediminicola]